MMMMMMMMMMMKSPNRMAMRTNALERDVASSLFIQCTLHIVLFVRRAYAVF
jgi:hypothetical protein